MFVVLGAMSKWKTRLEYKDHKAMENVGLAKFDS